MTSEAPGCDKTKRWLCLPRPFSVSRANLAQRLLHGRWRGIVDFLVSISNRKVTGSKFYRHKFRAKYEGFGDPKYGDPYFQGLSLGFDH